MRQRPPHRRPPGALLLTVALLTTPSDAYGPGLASAAAVLTLLPTLLFASILLPAVWSRRRARRRAARHALDAIRRLLGRP